MTREKQNYPQRRTIVDLSWPKGSSVNDAIHKSKYLDYYFYLQYPSVHHITKKMSKLVLGHYCTRKILVWHLGTFALTQVT